MTPTPKRDGEIRADSVFTQDEIEARLGIGRAALRQMRNNGLPIHRVGRRNLVVGAEFIAWVAEQTPLVK